MFLRSQWHHPNTPWTSPIRDIIQKNCWSCRYPCCYATAALPVLHKLSSFLRDRLPFHFKPNVWFYCFLTFIFKKLLSYYLKKCGLSLFAQYGAFASYYNFNSQYRTKGFSVLACLLCLKLQRLVEINWNNSKFSKCFLKAVEKGKYFTKIMNFDFNLADCHTLVKLNYENRRDPVPIADHTPLSKNRLKSSWIEPLHSWLSKISFQFVKPLHTLLSTNKKITIGSVGHKKQQVLLRKVISYLK